MKIDKVLVVDDSKVAHLTLRKMLTERGIDVDWVGSGEDSLTYLKQQQPNVIFMDVMMPGMDGFETTTAIKNNTSIASTPIIMCSANTTNEDKENAARLGALDFLSKPYTSEELDSVLNKVRELNAAAAAAAAPPAAPAAANGAPRTIDLGGAGGGEVHHAEQAAWATADKVAREVAGDIARSAAENAAREASEAGARKAVQAAQQAAKTEAENAVQAVLADITKNVSDEVMRSVNALIVQKLAEQKAMTPDVGKLRGDLQRELSQQITAQIEEAVAGALSGERVKQPLAQLLAQKLPALEDAGRRAAEQASHEAVQEMLANHGGVSKLGLVALLLSVVALGGVGYLLMLMMQTAG